jgi:hypothetical protein
VASAESEVRPGPSALTLAPAVSPPGLGGQKHYPHSLPTEYEWAGDNDRYAQQ